MHTIKPLSTPQKDDSLEKSSRFIDWVLIEKARRYFVTSKKRHNFMSYLHLILRAVSRETNVNRIYELRVDRGLFNSWLDIVAYGRYGGGFCQKIHSFFTLEEVKTFVNKSLKKRSKAEKRIGCHYTLISRSYSSWLWGGGLPLSNLFVENHRLF